MSDKAEKLSVEQLLQIEAVCDAFEADAQCQRRLPLEDYLTRVAPDLQPRLNRELKELMNEPKTLQAQHQERTFHQVNQPARQEMSFNSPTLRGEQLIEQETIARQQATQALATAQASIERAETEAALSQQSLEFLESVLASADPAAWVLGSQYPSLQSPPTMAELLDTAASRVEKEFANQPLVRIRLMETLAIGYRGIGRFEDAVHLLNRAQQARQELQDSSSETLDLASLKNRFHRGDLHQDVGEYDTAEQLFLDQLRQLDSQTSREAELMRADISFQMGWLLVTRHRSEESKPYFEKTLTLRQRHLPSNSNAVKAARIGLEFGSVQDLGELSIDQLQIFVNGDDRISVLASDYLEMLALRKLQKYDEAQVRYQRVLDELKEMLTDQHPLYLLALGDYAELLWRKGDFNAWPAI